MAQKKKTTKPTKKQKQKQKQRQYQKQSVVVNLNTAKKNSRASSSAGKSSSAPLIQSLPFQYTPLTMLDVGRILTQDSANRGQIFDPVIPNAIPILNPEEVSVGQTIGGQPPKIGGGGRTYAEKPIKETELWEELPPAVAGFPNSTYVYNADGTIKTMNMIPRRPNSRRLSSFPLPIQPDNSLTALITDNNEEIANGAGNNPPTQREVITKATYRCEACQTNIQPKSVKRHNETDRHKRNAGTK